MYNYIVIDDDEYAINAIMDYIEAVPELSLVKSYQDPLLALREISVGEEVDLIFMDVDMPMISGIELSKAIRNKTNKLVFTTSHSKYAFEAFEVEADAFLLKPYTLAKFVTTILKLFPTAKKNADDFFFVKNKEDNLRLVKVSYAEIIAIESLQNYIKIYTLKGNIITYMSLSEIKKNLPDHPSFIQVQRSYIISTNFITKIDGNTILLENEMKVIIGNYYRESILKFIREKTLRTGS